MSLLETSLSLGGHVVRSVDETGTRILRCIFCGQDTSDWWQADYKNSTCRCRACHALGIAETEKEKRGNPYVSSRVAYIHRQGKQAASQNSGGGLPLRDTAAFGASLSTCHNPPKGTKQGKKAVIKYRVGASVVTAKRERVEKEQKRADNQEVPKRGKVAGFSPKSRNRLMRTLAEVRRDCLPLFVTLTFPAYYPTIERAKRDLDTFIKRMARKFPTVAGVWKLEPQKRGAPHFHLLIWGASFAELLSFVPLAWYEIVGSGDPNHLAWHKGELGNSPCVQQIEKQQGVFWYASKYMSKEVGTQFSDWGRWWGVFHRNNLPLGEVVNVEVTEEKAVEFIRYMRRYARVKSRSYKSLTIICNADLWINRLL
jgi:hypothetical protein